MKTIRIIHLSDLHLSEENSFESGIVQQSLLSDLKNRVPGLEKSETYIAITGDLTYGGTEEQFKLVKEFSDNLTNSIDASKIVFCPGNHDLHWGLHTYENSDLMDDLVERGLNGVQRVERRFQNSADRSELTSGVVNYYKFLYSVNQTYSEYLYSLVSTNYESFKVNFISLNSAYLFSKKYSYYGYIGRTQLERATAESDARGDMPEDARVFNIMLFHHPFESIVPSSQNDTENLVKSRADLILNGHVHNLRVYIDLTASLIGGHNTRGHPVISGSRAVYDEVNDPFITPGYSIIDVLLNGSTVKGFNIHEIRYDKSRRIWYRDPNNPNYPFKLNFPLEGTETETKSEFKLRVADITDLKAIGMSPEDLVKSLIKLDYDSMPGLVEEDEGTLPQWTPIFSHQPYTWRILLDPRNNIIGYWHIVPLFDDDYHEVKSGKMYENEISEEKINSFDLPGHYKAYFRSIAMKEEYRGTEAVHLLVSSFLDVIEKLADRNIFVDEICANAYTPEGKALCKKFEMTYLGEHTPKGSLFFRDMSSLPNTLFVNEHPDLVQMYKREYNKVP